MPSDCSRDAGKPASFVLLAVNQALPAVPFCVALGGAMIGAIGHDEPGEESMTGDPARSSEWEIDIPYQAKFDLGGEVVCTEGTVRLRGNGTWYLRITIIGERIPVIELAGDGTTPAGIIRETIETTVAAARSSESGEASATP